MSDNKTVLEEIINHFEYIVELKERILEVQINAYDNGTIVKGFRLEIEALESSIVYKITQLQRYSLENNFYFFDCPLKVYQAHYERRKEDFFQINIDADELDFIKSEIIYLNDYSNNRKLEHFFYEFDYNLNGLDNGPLKISAEKKIEFLNAKLQSYGLAIYEIGNSQNLGSNDFPIWFFELKEFDVSAIAKETKVNNIVIGFQSFHYHREAQIINTLFDLLKSEQFICDSTKLNDFENAFCGKQILNKIKWIGKNVQLRYFIESLKNSSKIKVNDYWSLTTKIFIKIDGSNFSKDNLRTNNDVPSNSDVIDNILRKLDTTV